MWSWSYTTSSYCDCCVLAGLSDWIEQCGAYDVQCSLGPALKFNLLGVKKVAKQVQPMHRPTGLSQATPSVVMQHQMWSSSNKCGKFQCRQFSLLDCHIISLSSCLCVPNSNTSATVCNQCILNNKQTTKFQDTTYFKYVHTLNVAALINYLLYESYCITQVVGLPPRHNLH